MPRLLKSETARRLLAGQKSLTVAFTLLATPRTLSYEPDKTDEATAIGLIGVAGELAVSACLFEILGSRGVIRHSSGFYLTASEALASFRKTLQTGIPRLAVLTQGIASPCAHLSKLEAACGGFQVLFTARAAAVHAGEGTSRDVAFCAGKNVADFFALLAICSKWKPYLKDIPSVPSLPKERIVIAQELAASLATADKAKVGGMIANIFLVLPELTQDEPVWLEALERVRVAPRTQDISVLIKSLQKAIVGDLFKVGKGATAVATKIEPNNPNALPIYVSGMKKKFDSVADSWNAYVGTANAQIDNNILSLPPIAAVYAYAALGLDGIGLPPEEVSDGLSPHALWPFIAAALSYNGTKGPCFFLARALKPNETGQLAALLKKAAGRNGTIERALKEYLPLFEAAASKTAAQPNSSLAQTFLAKIDARAKFREDLEERLAKRLAAAGAKSKAGFESLAAELVRSDSVGACLALVLDGRINLGDDLFPALRDLIAAATEHEDVAPLSTVLSRPNLKMVATAARQAVSEIDYSFFGPRPSKLGAPSR
jgi:hypothetical protein